MTPPWARAILDIQAVDMRIRNIDTRLGLLPKERRRIADAKKKIDEGLEAVRNEIRQNELLIKKAESETAGLENTINKNRQQSLLIKKNTEYQAMLAAIDMSTEQISRLESLILEKMEIIDGLKEKLKTATARANASVKSLKAEWGEFDELEKYVKSEKVKLIQERETLRKALPTALGEEYDRLFNANDGEPLVPVENGSCGHCFMRITPHTLNQASIGNVVNCDNCRHLIYMEDAN